MKILWLSDSTLESNPTGILPDGCLCKIVGSVGEAVFALEGERGEFAGCCIWLPIEDEQPCTALEALHQSKPNLPIIFIRPGGAASEAVHLLKLGACHYFDRFPKQSDLERLLPSLDNMFEKERSNGSEAWRNMLVGQSPSLQKVADIVGLIAPRRSTVLILGETGSGKEVVARAIHQASPRANKPFVPVNCAAIPDELLEAELFGHVKGAFTGATNVRVGRFEQAHQGTLFLDEIGDMPMDLQAKLLRVLQEREFNRVGSSETTVVDVRVLAATNVDLLERVKQGKFREDLYYRLNVVPLRIPPLRERSDDIPSLVRHFIQKVCKQERLDGKSVSAETLDRLAEHPWPGNVRQLENAVEMAVVLSGERGTLVPGDFSLAGQTVRRTVTLRDDHTIALPDTGMDFERVIGRIELNLLEQALQRAKGNKKAAADMLGLKRTTLAAKLKSLECLVLSAAAC